MKNNRVKIKIYKPVEFVFEFTINPKNTSFWIDGIEVEKTNEWPAKIGTIYRNKDKSGNWSQYQVVKLDQNKLFELLSSDNNYHVRYIYSALDNKATELEYAEWVDRGELENPFGQEILEKLKSVIEKTIKWNYF